jgi:cytochrome P450
LTDVELRDEVKTFIVAGHETTSTWIYWALFALCQYPDVQEKVHEDVMEQSESLEGETMSLEVVEKMTYLDAFLKETLRFYPPVGTMIKHNTQPEVLGGVTVPTDSLLVIPVQLLHRSPLYWDQPESFLPERWLSADASPPYKHPMAFIPFSAGPRTCIGYKFATMEAKLILAPLIRAFRFQLASSLRDTKFELRVSLTLKAKPDFKALAVPR